MKLMFDLLYLICQRYKFESESQLGLRSRNADDGLYLICQRYKFESESQLQLLVVDIGFGCI